MKNILLLVVSTLSLTLAQNNTYAGCLMNSPNSLNLATGVSTNFFCSDNRCYNATRANITCTNRYSRDEVIKRTTTFTNAQDITITEL